MYLNSLFFKLHPLYTYIIEKMSDFVSRQAKKERKERDLYSRLLRRSRKERAAPYPRESPRRVLAHQTTSQPVRSSQSVEIIEEAREETDPVGTGTNREDSSILTEAGTSQKRKREDDGILNNFINYIRIYSK